ncbi:hypothetical protein [Gryllotalpicola koreensis]|uniref:Helix-turn-helix domain-containing protein n=1 Tax=Gryllotalpicola koreensis TaxID=993086 RepID=A0ABP7ZUM5_9MICO
MKVSVVIDLEPKLWWKLSGQAERNGVPLGTIIAEEIVGIRRHSRYRKITDEQVQRWKADYEAGRSASWIGRRDDIDGGQVLSHLRRVGVSIRSRVEQKRLDNERRRAVAHV